MAADTIVLPVIDMANFPTELDKLAAAATTLGCFRVINHGMPLGLAADMKAVARSLFDSPAEAKNRSGNSNDRIYAGGYISSGEISKFYESLAIYDAASTVDVHTFCSNLDATIEQRDIIGEYIGKLHRVIIDVACKVAESLSSSLVGFSFEEWPLLVRFNSYDFRSEDDIGSSAIPDHTDSGILTILQEDECVGGFELMDDQTGKFVSVDPVPAGALLVNIGDVGKAWSNGRLHNMKHRVICKDVIPRITIAMSLLAPKHGSVEPNPAFVDADHPKLYQTFNYNEYRKLRTTTGFQDGKVLPRSSYN